MGSMYSVFLHFIVLMSLISPYSMLCITVTTDDIILHTSNGSAKSKEPWGGGGGEGRGWVSQKVFPKDPVTR